MGYRKIPNLYKDLRVLHFRKVYALEKVHGTSANVSWDGENLSFYSGGEKHGNFIKIFDHEALKTAFEERCMGLVPAVQPKVTVYGEAFGGKQQGMSETYGKEGRFIAFEVKIGELWLDVPRAASFVMELGLEFVPWCEVEEDSIEDMKARLNELRDAPSIVARNCGITEPKISEGIVIRPPFEVRTNDGGRILAKHKGEKFSETKTKRPLDETQLKVLAEAGAIAEEWVTPMRVEHVVGQLELDGRIVGVTNTGEFIKTMVADVLAESEDEIVDSKPARKAISGLAAKMFKRFLAARAGM